MIDSKSKIDFTYNISFECLASVDKPITCIVTQGSTGVVKPFSTSVTLEPPGWRVSPLNLKFEYNACNINISGRIVDGEKLIEKMDKCVVRLSILFKNASMH